MSPGAAAATSEAIDQRGQSEFEALPPAKRRIRHLRLLRDVEGIPSAADHGYPSEPSPEPEGEAIAQATEKFRSIADEIAERVQVERARLELRLRAQYIQAKRRSARDALRSAELFQMLVDQWVEDTMFVGSPKLRTMHPAYQQIIGLGPSALPVLLRELRDRPDDWFWALVAISREDPAKDARTPDAARAAWLDWGRSRGLV